MPLPLSWLLEQLEKEGAVINQAPLIFVLSCLLILAIAFLLVRWLYKDLLDRKNALIQSLEQSGSALTKSPIWDQDRKAINQAVRVVGFIVGNSGLRDIGKPCLNFQFKVFNGSVYEISVDRKAEGYIIFRGNELKGRLEMLYDDQNVVNLGHALTGTFGLRLWLEQFSADYVIAAEQTGAELLWDFSYLTVMLAGEGVTPKPLSFDFVRYRSG